MKLRIVNHDGIANNTKIYVINENGLQTPLKNVTSVKILPFTVETYSITAELEFTDVELDLVAEKTTG